MHLDAAKYVLSGDRTKNGKSVSLPLSAGLVDILRTYLAGRKRTEPIWPASWAKMCRGAMCMRRDLERTRQAWLAAASEEERAAREASDTFLYQDHAGDVFDFHALRVQFITQLARAGVPLVDAQRLARHSSPALTAKVYTKLSQDDLARQLAKLPQAPRL